MQGQSYEFTNHWFEAAARNIWDNLIPQINPSRILEIGSYEGASSCYLIERLAINKNIEIHCVDSWEGGIEHQPGAMSSASMPDVEKRFHHNVKIAVEKVNNRAEVVAHKGLSHLCLVELLASGKAGYFDFIYVDGSHQAPDVLIDAVLSFQLLKVGGYIAFDDYLWSENPPDGVDPIRCPKLAIDAFTNIYCRKLILVNAPLYQVYARKVSD